MITMNIQSAGVIREKDIIDRDTGDIIEESLDRRILLTLFRLGIKPKNKGFGYLLDAIKIAIEDPVAASLITKCVYVDIARKYRVSPYAVERDIRTVILNIPITEFRYNVFAGDMGHYSNKQFIIHIAKYISC